MYSLIIIGALMFVLGVILTKIPIFRIAIGPFLFVAGGLVCIIGFILKG